MTNYTIIDTTTNTTNEYIAQGNWWKNTTYINGKKVGTGNVTKAGMAYIIERANACGFVVIEK